ncbi:MAG TPA: DUF469 family protein [Gammaproteobacteria bacterium]|nr:DUF469 family protein [Gammaproteobacteria bacterium]
MAKNRSRRLRKKLLVDEFQELGFCVEFQFSEDVGYQVLLDRWLDEAMEANGMGFGGGCDADSIHGFVAKRDSGSLTEEHRTIVKDWLSSQPEIKDVVVGPLGEDCGYDEARPPSAIIVMPPTR